jgi:hypothetical protein
VSKFKERMRHEWKDLNGHNAMEVLKRLNPIVRGWANYFRIGVSKHTFQTLDHWMFDRCARHVRSNHSRKGWRWCRSKYWGRLNPDRADRWVFGDKGTGAYLLKLSWTPIRRHVLVKGTSSPDDPDLRGYWTERERRKLEEGLMAPSGDFAATAGPTSLTAKLSTATTCSPRARAERTNAPTSGSYTSTATSRSTQHRQENLRMRKRVARAVCEQTRKHGSEGGMAQRCAVPTRLSVLLMGRAPGCC